MLLYLSPWLLFFLPGGGSGGSWTDTSSLFFILYLPKSSKQWLTFRGLKTQAPLCRWHFIMPFYKEIICIFISISLKICSCGLNCQYVSNGSDDLVLWGNKPFPGSLMTKFYDAIWYRRATVSWLIHFQITASVSNLGFRGFSSTRNIWSSHMLAFEGT